jgi:hypothetical protein
MKRVDANWASAGIPARRARKTTLLPSTRSGAKSDPWSLRDTGRVRIVPPERHLLRAKDLVDARYADPLEVDDLARGVEFTEAPEERPYGIDSAFRDPSGNQFRLTQVREPVPA